MRTIHLLIALRTHTNFDRQAFLGIAEHALTYGNIYLHVKHPDEGFVAAAKVINADGFIISSGNDEAIDEVAATGLPRVNVTNYLSRHAHVPVVGNDDRIVGQTGAEYFLERGFEHFAFFFPANNDYFFPRRDAFVKRLQKAGFDCSILPLSEERADPSLTGMRVDTRAAGEWLRTLPKPLAMLCPYDGYALEAIQACRLADLRVPEEVSVVGVDNDPLLCMSVVPQIASIATSAGQIGRTALDVVLSMLQGAPPPAEPVLIPPGDVVVRGSCSDQAIADRDVAAAVNFIRVHVRERLTVEDLAHHVALSRRTLERKFLEVLHRTPLQEIRRARIAHAKRLLAGSDLDLAEIARRSGLNRAQRLSTVFKQESGLTPLQFRRQHTKRQ